MGKAAKGSRKGKKAWRANISTADVEDYLEEATRQSRCLPLPSLPDESLFFLSNSNSDSHSTHDQENQRKKRKTELQREKPLRHEAPFRKNPLIVPLPPAATSKQPIQKSRRSKQQRGEEDNNADSGDDTLNLHIWNDGDNESQQQAQEQVKKKQRSTTTTTTTPIPAVEIEPLGCSFNPPFQAHQDALAKAVADEMQKLYKKELGPDPVPLTVAGEVVPEEEKFFLDADDGHESDDEETIQ